jgi:hypothetical protein
MGIDDVSLIDNAPVELSTPWAESEIFQVQGPQSADVLYQFHPDNPPYKLERRGHTTWSLVEVAWQDGPYLKVNVGTTTMTPSATTGRGITVTASSVDDVNDGQGFIASDLYRTIAIDNPASGVEWGWGIITAIGSTTSVTVDVKRDFGANTADVNWRLGAWSGTTGYPTKSTFFQERLYAGSTAEEIQKIWSSNTDDFEVMSPDSPDATSGLFDGAIEDDDSVKFSLSANNVNAIRWMVNTRNVMSIGTAGGEWVPESTGVVLTPADRTANRHTTHGSADVEPVLVDNVALFVQRAGRKIRQFAFTFESDGFEAFDMTRLARHITRGGIVEMSFAEEPDSLLWVVRSDGQMPSMTFRSQEDVVGWARHIIGGSFGTGNAVVESVTVIPGRNGAGQIQNSEDRDEVWVIVKRTINSVTTRYVEVLERDYEDGDAQEDSYYVDSCITYDGAAATVITGLSHLEGETVKILADGAVHADKTVASGQITLDVASSVVQIGLPYKHKLKTLKMEGGNAAGTLVGKNRRIFAATFVVLNSHTMKYGPDENTLTQVDFRDVSDPMDAGAPFATGEKFVEFEGPWTSDSRIYIESDLPVPFTLLGIAPEIDVNAVK